MTVEELTAALAARLTGDAADWLTQARDKVAADAAAIRTLFPAAGRRCGRGPLAAPAAAGGAGGAGGWTVDDAARTVLIAALPLTGSALTREIEDLYRYGDAAEKRGVLRALSVIDPGPDGLPVVRDALRTNDTRLVAAALGPYGALHLDAAAYRQGVLKCVFTGIPLAEISGLGRRTDDELVRMLRGFAEERIAAGRPVPEDVWLVVPRDPARPGEV